MAFRIPTAPWRIVMHDMDLAPAELERHAGLPPGTFNHDVAVLTGEAFTSMWDSLPRLLGDPDCGLVLAQSVPVETFDPAVFAALSSPNLATAMQRLSRFKQLLGPLSLEVEVQPEHTTLRKGVLGLTHLPHTLGLAEVTYLVGMARTATRHPIRPLSVTTASPLTRTAEAEAYFGVPVTVGDHYGLRFAAADMVRPFLTVNHGMWRFFEPMLNQRLAELRETASVRDRVRAALIELLPTGRSGVGDVAKTLAMSTRTLQRRLVSENTRYADVLASTREELSRHYLQRSEVTATEIALLLGYDDPNSFYRAFRSWTGTTPEAARAAR